MFSLPNDQVNIPIEVEGFALVPTDDFHFEAIKKKQPRLGNFLERFKTAFGDAVEPSTIVAQGQARPLPLHQRYLREHIIKMSA